MLHTLCRWGTTIKTRHRCSPGKSQTAGADHAQRGEDPERCDARPLLVGMSEGAAAREDSLAVSRGRKRVLIVRSSSHTPWDAPEGVKTLCPRRRPHRGHLPQLGHRCQDLGAAGMPFSS